jgi:predicted nucleic acid-binding protein
VDYLLDTSVLARLANATDAQYSFATRAVLSLHRDDHHLFIAPQNLVEFRSVATRPISVNGLGLSGDIVERQTAAFERAFTLLAETEAVYPAWKRIVQASGTIGKQVHDARLIAVCEVNAIKGLLTFNVQHFVRFVDLIGLALMDPKEFS